MFSKFEKIVENDICEFGHFGMSKGITEHLDHMKDEDFCLVARNKETQEMDFLIFDKDQKVIKESKSAETLLYWIDGQLFLKYGTAKPWLTNYKLSEEE